MVHCSEKLNSLFNLTLAFLAPYHVGPARGKHTIDRFNSKEYMHGFPHSVVKTNEVFLNNLILRPGHFIIMEKSWLGKY